MEFGETPPCCVHLTSNGKNKWCQYLTAKVCDSKRLMTANLVAVSWKIDLVKILVTADWSCRPTCTSVGRLRRRKTKRYSDLSIQVSVDSLLFDFLRSFSTDQFESPDVYDWPFPGKRRLPTLCCKFKTCITFSNTPCTIAPLPYLVMHAGNLRDFA